MESEELINILVNAGALLDRADENRQSVLKMASQKADNNLMKALISAGAKFNRRDIKSLRAGEELNTLNEAALNGDVRQRGESISTHCLDYVARVR